MLQHWYELRSGHIHKHIRPNLSEWLSTKHQTLCKALHAQAILPVDVLDAVVRSPSVQHQVLQRDLPGFTQLQIDIRELDGLYVSAFKNLKTGRILQKP